MGSEICTYRPLHYIYIVLYTASYLFAIFSSRFSSMHTHTDTHTHTHTHTQWALFKCHSIPEYYYWPWPYFMTHSSQSPDLDPIEHLWDVVGWEIRIMGVQPMLWYFIKNNMSYGYYHNTYTNQYSDYFNIVILPPNRQVCTFHWAIPMN